MTVKAYVLRIHVGREIQTAVLCPAARYVAIARPGRARPRRLRLSAAVWREIEWELSLGLPPTPLEADSAIVTALVPLNPRLWTSQSAEMRYVTVLPLDREPTSTRAAQLRKTLVNWATLANR